MMHANTKMNKAVRIDYEGQLRLERNSLTKLRLS
jgi:hypothetical protein